jgi:hypothetical protein
MRTRARSRGRYRPSHPSPAPSRSRDSRRASLARQPGRAVRALHQRRRDPGCPLAPAHPGQGLASSVTVEANPAWLRTRAPLQSRRVLRVRSARAGSVARIAGKPLRMRSLNDAVDGALFRIHVIQSVTGADRLGVCGRTCALSRTRKRDAGSARSSLYLAGESGARATQTSDSGYADRSREHLPHPGPCCVDAPWRRPLWFADAEEPCLDPHLLALAPAPARVRILEYSVGSRHNAPRTSWWRAEPNGVACSRMRYLTLKAIATGFSATPAIEGVPTSW